MIPLGILVALTATPVTMPATIAKAAPGDVVTLSTGDYGAVSVINRKGLTIDASKARLTSLRIANSSDVEWQGGVLSAPREQATGVTIDGSTRIRVAGMLLSGPRVGISAVRGDNYEIVGNRCDGIRSDCINLTIVHHVRVIGNQCFNFDPIPAVYDKEGKLITDGDHPDCVQAWSAPNTFALHDIQVIGNVGYGYMQGSFFGNASPLGFDRVIMRDNDMTIGAHQGISITNARNSVLRDNSVRATPGARLQGGNRGLVYPWVTATGDVVACGNVVAAQASRFGTEACAK